MALSDDQKAILRLLAQRGAQGYEDLSALMGLSVEEVHERAKGAAAELEAEGIPAPPIPAVGGEGDTPSGAKAGEAPEGVSPLPETPAAAPPAGRQKAEPVRSIPHHEHGHGPKEVAREAKLLKNRGLWAILAGVAIVVVFVVILLVSGSGGGSNSNSKTTSASESSKALEEAAAKQGKEVTKAVLNPVDGGEASGLAVFGRVKKSLALQVFAQGLEPTGKSEAYTIWLAASETKMLPLASTPVGKTGKITAQVEVPVEVLAYLANETFDQITITRTDDSQLEASLAKATKDKQAPSYTGTPVLRGAVTGPIIGAANKK
ncbi:MAG TPA: Lrp/AsnC family transcriptional regulator [Solirubrobacterales bacterium]|nr:Lrp/AsnC family transcriptional regulator [Solirubrobacterales bacterium]